MPKIITALDSDGNIKMVEIKHIRVMQDAEGNDVSVLDYKSNELLTEALANAESNKTNLESQLAAVNQEITELETIRDAE